MIYFLGGPPRVGKSIIAMEIARRRGISAVSTDSLGAVLETVVGQEECPGLFAVSQFNEMAEADRIELLRGNPTQRIGYQLEESAAVWRAVEPFVVREQEEGRDLVAEGVAVLPDLVNQLVGVDYRVAFLGNQAHARDHNIKRSARDSEQDWMRHASDVYVEAFASFVAEMSRYIEQEAHRYGFEYFELEGRPFSDAVGEVVGSLVR
jgi:2-phosphoglycerate kinase